MGRVLAQRRSIALPLLACALMLAASGDDFNLLRVALPFAAARSSPGRLPLDDPNTDAILPLETGSMRSSIVEATPAVDSMLHAAEIPWGSAIEPEAAVHLPGDTPDPTACTPLATPLRC